MLEERVVVAAVFIRRSRQTLLPTVTNFVTYDYLTVRQVLTLGSRLRFVVFANRVELQWKDNSSAWQVQSVWGESEYPES